MAEYHYATPNMADGAIIGRTASSPLGFYGHAPVTQWAVIAAVSTTGATADLGNLQLAFNGTIALLKACGLMATA